MGDVSLYIGGAAIFLWGIGHLVPTRSVVRGFGSITKDNENIITMEWIAEGLTLCFIGLLVLTVTYLGGTEQPLGNVVYWMSAAMLLLLAAVSSLTGARTSILPMKLCPLVKSVVAVLVLAGSAI